MHSRLPLLSGFIFILAGLGILFRDYYHLDWYFLRSYGFLVIGLLGMIYGLAATPPRGIYWFSFMLLVGIYYILGNWGIFDITRGLTIAMLTIIAGLALFVCYLSKRRWQYLLFGGLIVLLGGLFLLDYLALIPPYILVTVIDDYWPAVLIVIGMAYLIQSFLNRKDHSITPNSRA